MSGGLAQRAMFAPARVLMQEDIDAAVKQTLAKEYCLRPMPVPTPPSARRWCASSAPTTTRKSPPSRATIRGCIRARPGRAWSSSTTGTILTKPARGGRRQANPRHLLRRHESEANLVGAQPENDLAVLRAKSIPTICRPRPCAAPVTSLRATKCWRWAFPSASVRPRRAASFRA